MNTAVTALTNAASAAEAARLRLQVALSAEEQARQAFLLSKDITEVACVEALEGAKRNVANARLLIEKRQIGLLEAQAKLDEAEAAQRAAQIVELRNARARFLSELRETFARVLAARRAFAAVIGDVLQVVEREHQRASALRALREVEHSTPLDVVRLAIGQLIEREAPAERAQIEQLPTNVLALADSVLSVPTEDFETALRRLRNEFVATAGPSLADFCAPQPFVRSGASSLVTELNARDAAALLCEIEEQQ